MEFVILAILFGLVTGFLVWGRSQGDERMLIDITDAYRLGDGEEGDKLLAVARTRFTNTGKRLRLVQTLFDSRAYPQALKVVRDGLEAAPGHKKLRRYRVRISAAMMTDDAAELSREWLHENPSDERVLLDLAGLYHRLRRHEALLAILVPYVEANPTSREARSLLGRAYFAEGELDAARLHLTAAQKLRGEADRHQVAGYQFMAGAEYEVTQEERAHAEDDQRLLEQIADGTARGRTAVDFSTQRDEEPEAAEYDVEHKA